MQVRKQQLKIPLAVPRLGGRFHTGGFFQLTSKKWPLISQGSQREGSGVFTVCQGEAARLLGPGGRGRESERERSSPEPAACAASSLQPAGPPPCGRASSLQPAGPPPCSLRGLLPAACHPRFLNLIVFHFLITLLPHPKPNTETSPSIYEAPRRAIKVSAICCSLPGF